jgi:hypothetical protein
MKPTLTNAIVASPLRAQQREIDRLAALLAPPFDPNHGARHPALGSVIAEEVKRLAAIYVFDEESILAAWSIMATERRRHHVFQHCRAPHPKMFFEYQHEGQRHGVFTEGDRDNCLITVFNSAAEFAVPLIQARVNFAALTIDDYTQQPVTFFRLGKWSSAEHVDETVLTFQLRLVAAVWMFLSIGGATTVDRVLTREGRLARHRRKPFACGAIDSFNRVRLNIPGAELARSTVRFHRGPGVRFHDVRGHWREISVADGKVLRWIAAFWRGDFRLGVVVKQRAVRTTPMRGASPGLGRASAGNPSSARRDSRT